METDLQELRLECLHMAIRVCKDGVNDYREVLFLAGEFFKFITQGESKDV